MAEPKIKTGNQLYSVYDIVDKTLVARRKIPIYDDTKDDTKPFGYVDAGSPVGVVWSWLEPNRTWNRSYWWWIFQPPVYGDYYYARHESDAFDVDALRQQGVITVQEKIEEEKKKEEDENKPWYEKIADKAGNVIIIAVLGAAAITAVAGGLKRKKNNNGA